MTPPDFAFSREERPLNFQQRCNPLGDNDPREACVVIPPSKDVVCLLAGFLISRYQLGVVSNFPKMTVGVFEVTAIASPKGFLAGPCDDGACFFGLREDAVYFSFTSCVVANRKFRR